MTDTTFSDSYIATDAALETLIGADPRAGAVALEALAAATQCWYCQEATRIIDNLRLQGTKYEYDQDRAFPRIINMIVVGDADQNAVVPDEVERACVLEAIAIYESVTAGTDRAALQDAGVASYQIPGILSETFRPGAGSAARSGMKSIDAYNLLSKWIARSVPIR